MKISEYRAKKIIATFTSTKYMGICVDLQTTGDFGISGELIQDFRYVVKVDQAVKKRNKLGLVKVDLSIDEALEALNQFKSDGYRYALVEPFIKHNRSEEQFVALQRHEDGIYVQYSKKGGVNIESESKSIESALLSDNGFTLNENTTSLDSGILSQLYEAFQDNHMTYLEINPFIVIKDSFIPLDAAVEVDSSAEFFVNGYWGMTDTRKPKAIPSQYENEVEMLASKSPSSLSLKVLNPDGSIFLLLSGGGASVVVADEIASLGRLKDMANYGEYSGNPTEQETYLYTTQVLKMLIASKSPKKILLIVGGVANFTDIEKTFKGIVRAMVDYNAELVRQKVVIFVRRGGPNQEKGLKTMSDFLASHSIKGDVSGPDVSLSVIVKKAIGELS